uniref:Uncharacterized protein n=1 Tax=Onchocerca volvulus TaxID=6282 RepID=A0A8R1XZ14_ONCVO
MLNNSSTHTDKYSRESRRKMRIESPMIMSVGRPTKFISRKHYKPSISSSSSSSSSFLSIQKIIEDDALATLRLPSSKLQLIHSFHSKFHNHLFILLNSGYSD